MYTSVQTTLLLCGVLHKAKKKICYVALTWPKFENCSKFFAQIWQKKKKKKKPDPVFFAFYGRSGEGNITIFWGGPNRDTILAC